MRAGLKRGSTPMERVRASERTREKLKPVIEGRSEGAGGSSELVRLAARLIIEEALEGRGARRRATALAGGRGG